MTSYYVRVERDRGATRTYKGPMTRDDAHHYAARYIDPHGSFVVDVVHERRVLADVGGRWCLERMLADAQLEHSS